MVNILCRLRQVIERPYLLMFLVAKFFRKLGCPGDIENYPSCFSEKDGLAKGCNSNIVVYNRCGKRIYEFKVLRGPSSKRVIEAVILECGG